MHDVDNRVAGESSKVVHVQGDMTNKHGHAATGSSEKQGLKAHGAKLAVAFRDARHDIKERKLNDVATTFARSDHQVDCR